MIRSAELGRLVRTVRHLRPEQIWHRGRLTARRFVWERLGNRIDQRYWKRAAEFAPPRWDAAGLARLAALRASRRLIEERMRAADDALEGRFRFLGRTEELGREVAWQRADLDSGTRLWKTLLHELPYAEDLAVCFRKSGRQAYRERLWDLVASWRKHNPIGCPGFARDAWNARAVASRMLHLAVAAHLVDASTNDAAAIELGRDLARHTLFLRDNLEWDLGGNHLLRDLLGLLLGGTLFDDALADEALALLHEQIGAQVLADGCHVERTPLYHAVVLQDLVEARALVGDRAPGWLHEAIDRMARYLRDILHGDGELPLFGDSWHGEIEPKRLLREVGTDGSGAGDSRRGEGGGLVALGRGSIKVIVRAGAHGPDHQLGHAHGDLLSFELSHGRHRIVTDTGTGTYDAGPMRTRTRSTAAHNTVQVDGAEQLESWASFRVGRRGRAEIVARGSGDGIEWLWARHDAYGHLPGAPVHDRLVAAGDDVLLILDAVSGHGKHRIANRLHIHPDAPGDLYRLEPLGGSMTGGEAPFYERFGRERIMTELSVEAERALPWHGGWLVLMGPGRTEGELWWTPQKHELSMRYDSPRLLVTARWLPRRDATGNPQLSVQTK